MSNANEKAERRIQNVMEKSGWTREETLVRLKDAKARLGISYGFYDDNDFHLLSCQEQAEKYAQIIAEQERQKKSREAREKRICHVMEKSGWTREETLVRLRDVRTRWGISFGEYDKYDLHLLTEEELPEKCAEILAKREKLREKSIELAAVQARKAFVAAPKMGQNKTADSVPASTSEELKYQAAEGVKQNTPADKQPEPIIAACYYLGIPMPGSASCAYQPSAFVSHIRGDLNSIRDVLGEELLPDTEISKEKYDKFKKKYDSCKQLQHNETDLAIYYTDWLMHCEAQGYNFDDYFDYEFFNKELSVRQEYMSNRYRGYIRKLCNTDIHLFMNKGRFNAFFADEIHRDWLDITRCDYDEFLQFITKHDRFFAKPITGTGGNGACVISSDIMEAEKLFAHCKENGYIVEQVVRQHSDMAQFCPDTVNTLRVYSLVDADGNAAITGALCRFGRMGNCVDNFHCGGICTLVDIDTGAALDYAVDRAGNHCTMHPDTGFPLKGFVVPNWQRIKQTVMSAAEKCAHINRHAGWDIAITESGEAEFIEGNSRPNFDILQATDKVGKMYRYKDRIDRLADKLDAAPYDYPHMTLDISGMER